MSLIVIKYGGSLLDEPGHRTAFLKSIALLSKKQKLVLVHGGGKEISRQMEQSGITPRFVNGRRFTDDATMAVVIKALAGVNQQIVAELKQLGADVQGGSGRDGHMLEAAAIGELGRVGMPTKINQGTLQKLLGQKALPVLYSVAEDEKKEPLNINADDFAQALAVAAKADQLIFLTDTGGVLDTNKHLIERITPADIATLTQDQIVTGGMLVKVQACVDALKTGVGRVDIVKGIDYLLSPEAKKPEGTVFSLK
jgi:acetylglutamate kinase